MGNKIKIKFPLKSIGGLILKYLLTFNAIKYSILLFKGNENFLVLTQLLHKIIADLRTWNHGRDLDIIIS